MPLAPVDYGPQVYADPSGLQAQQQAQQKVFGEVRQLGSVTEGGAAAITQGLLHTQALKATAAVKTRQASTLEFIDSHPYIPKAVLQQRMTPEDYTAWHAGLATEYKDADTVPMFAAAGALFDSEAKQARGEAGQIISLPGWRGAWDATERTESSTIRERYVNRIAADQMQADQRYQTLNAIDKTVDAAVKPEDLDAAAKMAQTSPWLKPAERKFTMEKVLAAKDAFVARQAMLGGDTEVMKAELLKLKSDNSAELFPNMNVKQRLDLANQLTREYSYKAAKDVAEKQIVGPNVSETGKVNRTKIAEDLAAYTGPDKEGVTRAVKAEEDAKLDIFNKKMTEVQQSILKAGRDPMTGRFSYAKAMQNPAARKAAVQLNDDASGLLTDLSREDQRWENIDAKATALEQREARAALVKASGENLEAVHKAIDRGDFPPGTTPAQFDTQLYNRAMTEPDRDKARTAFAQFLKMGRPDERPRAIVSDEISQAAGGDPGRIKQIKTKFEDRLIESAHGFIRAHQDLAPDAMNDALRKHIKDEMVNGKVVGTGLVFDKGARRIEWETNPDYQGKDFQLKDGTVIKADEQRVRLTRKGQTMDFPATDAAAARADGWK